MIYLLLDLASEVLPGFAGEYAQSAERALLHRQKE